MAKTKVSEWDSTPGNNTDIDSINIAEGCAPSGINNAIRELMSQVKDYQQGTYGDTFNGPVNGTVGATTPSTGAFTTLSASGAFSLSGDQVQVSEGGTGASSFTSGGILRGNGTSALSVASASDITSAIGSTAVTNATNLVTTNFSIVESGGSLLIKYGATTIVTISSGGAISAVDDVTAYGSV